MKYDEPEWIDTFNCAYMTGCPIIIADRSGIGSMASAYNKALVSNWDLVMQYKYVWFVSNIVFTTQDFANLHEAMEVSKIKVIHPTFDSDHAYLKPNIDMSGRPGPVPFVEFTAPLCETKIFDEHDLFLDEDMPFAGHDLDWGHRARSLGIQPFVHYGVFVQHTYIRHNSKGHEVTDIRHKVRKSWKAHTEEALIRKYGTDWETILKYKGGI